MIKPGQIFNKTWKKAVAISVVTFFVLCYLVLPWTAEGYLESNDEELIGRQVEVQDISFNVLTGGFGIDKLVVFEADKQAVFFQVERVYVNFELWQILFGTYALAEVSVDKPQISIKQNGAVFNFDDLVTRFTSSDTTTVTTEPTEPVNYQVENVRLSQGMFSYNNIDLGAELKIVKVNTTCPLMSSEVPILSYAFDFVFDKGGKAKGTFDLDMNSQAYRSSYELDSLFIGIFRPYLSEFMNTGNLTGLFTSHQQVAGNFNTPTAIATRGMLRLNDFSLTDPKEDKLIGFAQWKVEIDSLDMKEEIYDFDYVSVDKPYFKVELYEEGNNFSRLMKEAPASTSDSEGLSSDSLSRAAAYGNIFALMAAYVKEMSQLYAFSDYNADSLVVRHGTLVFNDFTLHNRFNYLLEDLMIKADKVSSSKAEIKVDASSILNTSGLLKGQLRVDPHGFNNMNIDYSITGLRVSDFNPYSYYYVAHPFTDGICNYVSKSSVQNNYLKSNHKLDIESIKVGKKVKNETAYKIPVRLAVALLRDKNGDVHLELPIEGNLNDPKYKVGKVIWQVFRNLITKAVAAPGKLLAGKAGVEEKMLEGFDWTPLQTELTDAQKQSLDALAKSLETTPEMKVELVRIYNHPLETDELAVREGKKKFLFLNRRIKSEDEIPPDEMAKVDQVQHNDSTFNSYLDSQVKSDGELVSVYEKSRRVTGSDRLRRKLEEIYLARNNAVLAYLTTEKALPAERFSIGDPAEAPKLAYATHSRVSFRFFVEE